MDLSFEDIKRLIKGGDEDLERLRGEAEEHPEEIVNVVNEEVPGFSRNPLLHDVFDNNYYSSERVQVLIEIGADPLKCVLNGDTPLHKAVRVLDISKDDHKAVIENLLDTKHRNCPEPDCHSSQPECYCGFKALSQANNRLRCPKDELIKTEFKHYLIEKGRYLTKINFSRKLILRAIKF